MKKDKSVSWHLQPELMDTTEITVDEILVTEIETLACLEDSRSTFCKLSNLDTWLNNGCQIFKITENQIIKGFCLFRILVDEIEILDIIIQQQSRGRGLGKCLLEHVLDFSKSMGCLTAWLEVRKTNDAARQLYPHIGFEIHSIRKNYYSNKKIINGINRSLKEDALLMKKSLE